MTLKYLLDQTLWQAEICDRLKSKYLGGTSPSPPNFTHLFTQFDDDTVSVSFRGSRVSPTWVLIGRDGRRLRPFSQGVPPGEAKGRSLGKFCGRLRPRRHKSGRWPRHGCRLDTGRCLVRRSGAGSKVKQYIYIDRSRGVGVHRMDL